jgi:ADP-ribose pyrophosphatase YjhB (NUDIX family)
LKSSRPPIQFCTQCGSSSLKAAKQHEYICFSCGFRHFINPIAAVAGILSDPHGTVLLVRRAHDPGRGLLGLPGGFVDVGETGEEALRREILEEINLRVSDLAYFISLPNKYHSQGIATPVLDCFYTAQLAKFDDASANEEIHSLEPVHLEELDWDQIAFPSNRKALQRFLKMRQSRNL